MANLELREITVKITKTKVSTVAEAFCCDPMQAAWQTFPTWSDGNSIVSCPFCGQPVVILPPEERIIER